MRLLLRLLELATLVLFILTLSNAFQLTGNRIIRDSQRALVPPCQQRKPFATTTTVFYQQGETKNTDEEERFDAVIPETSFGAEAVPESQRPVNEFLDISRQPLFDWAALDSGNQGFFLRLAITYATVFGLVCYPIAGATYTQDGYLLQKIAASNVGAMSLLGVLMIRIYSGWGYVGSRLTSKVIEFEETGWYDGDIEYKTEAEMRRDRFLYKDKVQPVVNRVKTFCLAIGGMWLASILAFNVASSYKPMFSQYDPRVLEKMSYDEKLAEAAAQSSGGKPIYCDSRYYRAIANGGQGCD